MNKNYSPSGHPLPSRKNSTFRKSGLFMLLAVLGMLPAAHVFGQSSTLISPTINNGGFESGTTGWTFVGSGQTNYWVVGSGNYFSGTQAAYITNSTAAPYDYNYDNTATSASQMYMDVTFPAGQPVVTLTFAVDCFGEDAFSPFDVLDVSLAPTSVTPVAGTPLNDASAGMGPYSLTTDFIGNVSGWRTITINIPQSLIGNTTSAVTRRLIFEWQNDNSNGSEPAAIDDVILTSSCQGPIITGPSPVGTTTATLNWNAVTGATSYNVRYKLTTDPYTVATWATPTSTPTNSLALSGLTPNQTQYDYEVSAIGGSCDAYSLDDTFQTLCNVSLPYLETFEGIVNDDDLPTCMSVTNLGSDVYTYSSSTSPINSSQVNHTPGGQKFAAFGGEFISVDDYIFTPAFNLIAGSSYQFTFWYDALGSTDWGTIAGYYGTSNTPSGMTNLISEVNAPDNNGYVKYTGTFIPATTGVYNMGIYCNGFAEFNEFMDIDDIGLTLLPPCAGMPDAGNITPAGPLSGCTGSTIALSNTGAPVSGAVYQWQMSTISNPTWVDVPGANTTDFTSPALADTTYFRLVETCTASGLANTTAPVTVNVPKPIYATLPAVEDFENWVDRCNSLDVPSYSWTNQPSTGNPSWRRDDQGVSNGAWGSNSGNYTPASFHAAHSARFHSENTQAGITGTMDYYVDCSSVIGTKELQLYSINESDFSNADFLDVQYSTNGAAGPFTDLGQIGVNDTWTLSTFSLPTNSATVVVRFIGTSDYGSTDIGLDYVRILSPCAGAPTAGTVTATNACSGQNFTLGVQGNTQAGALTYQWQQSTDGTTWTSIAGATADQTIGNITAPTYFRLIVTCSNSSMSDTSAPLLVNLAAYYYCYCASAAQYDGSYNSNIGNVNIVTQPGGATVLDNGNATPLLNNTTANNAYTDFTALTPAIVYRNSTYTATVSAISNVSYVENSRSAIYVDYNHDGVYDVTTEKLITADNDDNTGIASADFTVPATALTGLTGMRVILDNYASGTLNPCGLYGEGETEDYIIDVEPQPCSGAPNAGTASVSDTSICFGYTVDLVDATHDTAYGGVSWTWQQSTDGGTTWNTVPASANMDSLFNVPVSGPSEFRLAVLCSNSSATTYSNVVNVNIKPASICYCTSIAIGGRTADSSDITAFTIGNFVMAGTGPHLNNPNAVRGRTDYTDLPPIQLPSDSTVGVSVYQTMLRGSHADGKVTVFIDYNNNHVYDIPSERVWTGYTTLPLGYEATTIYIPSNVVLNTPTGLRVIANNDVNPNTPSDDACGTYTSGETEDYLVVFHQPVLGIGSVTNIQSLQLYPNPTTGAVNLQMNMQKAVTDLQIVVTNITGQQIATRTFHNTGTQFSTQLDLSGEARGVYFIEIKADGDRSLQRILLK